MIDVTHCLYCRSGLFWLIANSDGELYAIKCQRCRVIFSVALLQDPAACELWVKHERAGIERDRLANESGRD